MSMRPAASTPLLRCDLHGCFARDRRLAAGPLPAAVPASVWRPATSAPTARWAAPGPPPQAGTLPQIGDVIDKYRIEERLGHGGFAAVYRATHLLMQAPVALKLLLPEVVARHPHCAERMCDEARFTALVNHPNVVRVYDVTHGQDTTYIVMEYLAGASLAKHIEQGPLAVEAVIRLGMEICSGLHAALEHGLVHCDIKPANILIARDGHAKLVDFGQARRRVVGDDTGTPSTDLVGTPAYMAPEQIEDPSGFDHRADIYALGATLYHALTGQTLFPGGQPLQTIYHHLHTPVPDPCLLAPDCPLDLRDLLQRMLAKAPADRPARYDAVSRELAAILDEMTLDLREHAGDHSGSELFGRLRRLFGASPPTLNTPARPGR